MRLGDQVIVYLRNRQVMETYTTQREKGMGQMTILEAVLSLAGLPAQACALGGAYLGYFETQPRQKLSNSV